MPRLALLSASALLTLLAIVLGGWGAVGAARPRMPYAQPLDGAPSSHLVFVSNRDGDWDLYGATADGTRVAILTRNADDDTAVVLSPTGGWVAVERALSEVTPGVTLVSADGRRERALRPGGRAGVSGVRGAGVFSPDGRTFAFGREVGLGDTVDLMLAGVASGRARRIGVGLPDGFSPDGRLLAAYWDDYRVVDIRTGTRVLSVRELTSDETFSPRWTRLAYLTGADEQEALVVVNVGREPRRRVLARGELADISWLDERRLSFSRRVTGADGETTTELVVADVDVDGAGAVVLADGRVGAFQWSPSATAVAYVRASGDYASDDHRESLEVTSVDRAAPIVLVQADGISSFAWSSNGRRMAVASWNDGGDELAVIDAAGAAPRVRVARGVYADAVVWSPDDRILALVAEDRVAVVPATGGRLRRLVHAGRDRLVGWMRGPLPATALRVPPLPALETAGPTLLRARGAVRELASDRGLVAAVVGRTRRDCEHVVAWTAGSRRVVRFSVPAPCEDDGVGTLTALRVAGRRVTWYETTWGNEAHVSPCGADLARPAAGGCGEETGDEEAPPRIVAPRETRRGVRLVLDGGTVVLTRAADGRVRRLRPVGGAVDAELEETGLFYAYNAHGAAMPGRVASIPFRMLFASR